MESSKLIDAMAEFVQKGDNESLITKNQLNKERMKKVTDKIYIVKYSEGSYEDYLENIIFATINKSTATKYVTRYNKILKKWTEYYSQFEEIKSGINWIKDEFINTKYNRWYCLRKLNKCFWEEVEIR